MKNKRPLCSERARVRIVNLETQVANQAKTVTAQRANLAQAQIKIEAITADLAKAEQRERSLGLENERLRRRIKELEAFAASAPVPA